MRQTILYILIFISLNKISLFAYPLPQLSLFELCKKSEFIFRGEIYKIEKGDSLYNLAFLKSDKVYKGIMPKDSTVIFQYDPFFICADIDLEPRNYVYVFLSKNSYISDKYLDITNPPSGIKIVNYTVVDLYDSLITETQHIVSLPDIPDKMGQIKNLFVSYINAKEFAWDGARELDPSDSNPQYYLSDNFLSDNPFYNMLTEKDKAKILEVFSDYPFYKKEGFSQMFQLVAYWNSNKITETLLSRLNSTPNTADFYDNHNYMLFIAKRTGSQKASEIARKYYKSHGDLKILVDFLDLYEN